MTYLAKYSNLQMTQKYSVTNDTDKQSLQDDLDKLGKKMANVIKFWEV